MVAPGAESVATGRAPRFIYLAGCDGTGKTTQARLLVNHLRANGVPAHRLWLRFPFCLSLPLLAYARLRGFSHYEKTAGFRHGYWDFAPSRLLSSAFPWVLLIDAALASLWRVYLPLWLGRTIVCERFVLDMLVDLSLALEQPGFHRTRAGGLFLRLLPPGAAVLVLDLDAGSVRARRPSLRSDRLLEARLCAYRRLAAGLGLATISSSPPVEIVHHEIVSALSPLSVRIQFGGYGKVRSPILRRALAYPVVALASHWLFQGFFCMGWGERAFKLALDLLLALGLTACLRLFFPWPAALLAGFLTAHSLNFLFNGHLWGALKHYGAVSLSPEEFSCYIAGILERAEHEPAIAGIRVSGSLARRAWTPASDFDARLVPTPGALNLCRACCFLIQERSRALFARFPLDIYLE